MLRRDNVLDRLEDCMPVINYMKNSEERDKMFELEMKLSGWHHYYRIHKIGDEVKKMKELLGNPDFEGKSILEYEIEFFITQYIWTFVLDEDEDAVVVLYLNEEGLSVEVSDECENHLVEIMEELINIIIK